MTLFQPEGAVTGLPLPIPLETFISLSDVTGAQLEQAVYHINPHWVIQSKAEAKSPKG